MDANQYLDWLRQYASDIGLDPELAESVWKQESGGSLDTALKGETLSRNRGNAVGPWQVVPAYHPDFPVDGDPVAQGQYAMNYLKEVGPARYYGTGKPPEGHPTSEEYVQQVRARAAGLSPDVRQAAATAGVSTDTNRIPSGDPATGRMTPMYQPNVGLDELSQAVIDLRQNIRPPSQDGGMLGILAAVAGGLVMSSSPLEGLAAASYGLGEAGKQRKLDQINFLETMSKTEDMLSRAESRRSLDAWAQTLPPDLRQMVKAGGHSAVMTDLLRQRTATPSPPTMREVQIGDQTVTMAWDPSQGGWAEVARAPRWQPPQPTSPFGGVPAGMQRVPDPASPTGTALVPEPGSPVLAERTAKVEPLKLAVERIDRMRGMIEQYGTELFGEHSGTMRQLYAQTVADIAKLRDMGVLQPGELVNIEASLTNPASYGSILTGKATVQAQYAELRRSFAEKLKSLGVEAPPDSAAGENDALDAEINALRDQLHNPGGATGGGF